MTGRAAPGAWGVWHAVLGAVAAAFAVSALWLAPAWVPQLLSPWVTGGMPLIWALYSLVAVVAIGIVVPRSGDRGVLTGSLTGLLMGIFAAPLPSAVSVLLGLAPEMHPMAMVLNDAFRYAFVSGVLGLALGSAAVRAGRRAVSRPAVGD